MIEYNRQNYTGAADLADVAYIDNFEFLAAPSELTLREELSRLIEERAQPQQVQELINEINGSLDQAEQLLINQN